MKDDPKYAISAKIDESGRLHLIDTHGSLEKRYCPFSAEWNQGCGDWCPLFGYGYVTDNGYDVCVIEICQGRKIRVLKDEFVIEQPDKEAF